MWDVFRKYHYLNTEIHKAAAQYVGILNDETVVCHTGVLQAAMKPGVKRVHRFVTLPDYQGIGIGTAFINFIGDLYLQQGLKFNLITTTPALRFALDRDPKWFLRRSGNVTKPGKSKLYDRKYKHLGATFSCDRVTYSYDYTNDAVEDLNEHTEAPVQPKPEKRRGTLIQLSLFDDVPPEIYK